AGALSNLAAALWARFDRVGDSADLDEAIRLEQLAMELTPEADPKWPFRLGNHGKTLQTRFSRTGELSDLDEAIRLMSLTVATVPESYPDRSMLLCNVSLALLLRFERTRVPADLDEALRHAEQAVATVSEPNSSKGWYLSTLGNALQARFELSGDLADLDEAIRVGELALQELPDGSPAACRYLMFLGHAWWLRFQRTEDLADLNGAAKEYVRASTVLSAHPEMRVRSLSIAALFLVRRDGSRAAKLMESAIYLLPELASHRLDRADRQHALNNLAIASDAAALALLDVAVPKQQRAERALSLLEAGRAVLLSQALGTRGEFTDLSDAHPELAKRLTELREVLYREPEHGRYPEGPAGQPLTPRPTMNDRAQAAERLNSLYLEIRALPGFERFGLPQTIDHLRALAASGPIVSFVVSSYHSAALILTEAGVTALPLPGLAVDL